MLEHKCIFTCLQNVCVLSWDPVRANRRGPVHASEPVPEYGFEGKHLLLMFLYQTNRQKWVRVKVKAVSIIGVFHMHDVLLHS